MAKAFQITSDPFFVNGNVTTDVAGTFTQTQISLPLDSLNQEGILVHAAYFTSSEPDNTPNTLSSVNLQVTSTSKTAMVGANDANLIAKRQMFVNGGAAEFSGPHVQDLIGATGPYQESDNLGLVATDDLFFACFAFGNAAAKSGQVRLVCSRIKLTASAYAALVTNELSS